MALTRVTKHIVHGSLLVQFKYVENNGDFDINTSSSTFTQINSKNILLTPQYADSILETQANLSVRDMENVSNVTDTYQGAIYVNDSQEYLVTSIGGLRPYGNQFSHHGGRNDRLRTSTSRHGHATGQSYALNMNHAYTPGTTNEQDIDVRARCTADRNFRVRDLFLIAKEISIGLASSGGQ